MRALEYALVVLFVGAIVSLAAAAIGSALDDSLKRTACAIEQATVCVLD